jgi:hypothetical protein
MQKTGKTDKIDYAKLLGFEAVAKQISGGVDFQDETISAKLGAKVGAEVDLPKQQGIRARPGEKPLGEQKREPKSCKRPARSTMQNCWALTR